MNLNSVSSRRAATIFFTAGDEFSFARASGNDLSWPAGGSAAGDAGDFVTAPFGPGASSPAARTWDREITAVMPSPARATNSKLKRFMWVIGSVSVESNLRTRCSRARATLAGPPVFKHADRGGQRRRLDDAFGK